jgi:hypothetical protein
VNPRSAHEPAAAGSRPTEQDISWPALGLGIFEDLVAVLRERLHLLALEGQQFALAAGQLLMFGVIAAILILTAWFVLVGGILAGLVQAGVPWMIAVAGGVLANVVAALLVWRAMRRLLALMMFPATLRRMRLARERAGARHAEGEGAPAESGRGAATAVAPAEEAQKKTAP